MKINSINGKSTKEWEKENSVDSKKYVEINLDKFSKEAIEVAMNLGLIIQKEK